MSGFGSSGIQSGSATRIVVSVGEAEVTNQEEAILSTFALGSCVGIVAYDSGSKVGGMHHVMLPSSSISPDRAKEQPLIFADTGLSKFLNDLQQVGASLDRLKFLIAGGASIVAASDSFKIGEQNIEAVRARLQEKNLRIVWEDLGGLTNRSLHLNMKTRKVKISLPDNHREVDLS